MTALILVMLAMPMLADPLLPNINENSRSFMAFNRPKHCIIGLVENDYLTSINTSFRRYMGKVMGPL